MSAMSLVGTASCLPETIVERAHVRSGGASAMFLGSKHRRHVGPDDTAVNMIERASRGLIDRLGIKPSTEIDILLTNVTCGDIPFTGCGAAVAHVLGARPSWIVDVQNTGCVSFVYMMELARALMAASPAKTALICNVQNAAGRVFGHPDNLKHAQSAVPGDGCGVGYLVANAESPVLSIVSKVYGEYAEDMRIVSDDGAPWWAPRATPVHIDFSDARVATIVSRGNALVPSIVKDALRLAEVRHDEIDVLVTNQPNATFLRNWREALQVGKDRHVHTFEEHGNLFGAAIPISIERAVHEGKLTRGKTLVMGGFSHAGDYAAASVVRWQAA
jgi:3-oxoacyl-[acyl-carrier-protein] synthase-3